MRTRLRATVAGPEGGMSLVEVLVSMFMVGIITAAVTGLTIGFTQTNARNVSRQDQVDIARVAVERMSKTLRTAVVPSQLSCAASACDIDAFLEGRDFSVQFYANLDNRNNLVGPSRVTYTVATDANGTGTLTEKVQTPDSHVPGAAGYVYCNAEMAGATGTCRSHLKTRVLANGVILTSGRALFTYYDVAGTAMVPAAAGGTLTAALLGKVTAVELTVTVQAQRAMKANPTTYIQRITLPNAQSLMRQNEET